MLSAVRDETEWKVGSVQHIKQDFRTVIHSGADARPLPPPHRLSRYVLVKMRQLNVNLHFLTKKKKLVERQKGKQHRQNIKAGSIRS